jgi:hypothetical protein
MSRNQSKYGSHIYIYIYICVCVCKNTVARRGKNLILYVIAHNLDLSL